MSEYSGAHEQSEQGGSIERVSGASERANGQASGPVLTSGFLFVLDHSALQEFGCFILFLAAMLKIIIIFIDILSQ